jgi:hypothetical protein
MSHDDDQTLVPESFIALFRDARQRLVAPRREIAARHEFCDDMASLLVDHCRTVHFCDGVDEDEILVRCHRGLVNPPTNMPRDQAWWTIRRTAELLGWQWLSEEPPGQR